MNDEMKLINERFNDKQGRLPNSKIIKVQRIQNQQLYKDWSGQYNLVMDKNRKFYNDKTYEPEVKYLWHGTSETSPAIICEEGFDQQFESQGKWGKGLYFARDFKYSAKHYSYKLDSTTRQLFLVKVIIGKTIKLEPDKELIKPPINPDIKQRYDSVNQLNKDEKDQDENIYIIYDRSRYYPEYLIDFQM